MKQLFRLRANGLYLNFESLLMRYSSLYKCLCGTLNKILSRYEIRET